MSTDYNIGCVTCWERGGSLSYGIPHTEWDNIRHGLGTQALVRLIELADEGTRASIDAVLDLYDHACK